MFARMLLMRKATQQMIERFKPLVIVYGQKKQQACFGYKKLKQSEKEKENIPPQ